MAVFSTNQNRHLYVVKKVLTDAAAFASAAEGGTLAEGDLALKVCDTNPCDKELYFLYKGAGGILRSDRIPVKNVNYVKFVPAADMITPLKKIEVELADNPVGGEDYVLRIAFRQFYGMSDQDQYFKDAAVHATSSMSKADFYKAMVKALNLAFSRELGATKTSNPYLDFSLDNDSTPTKLIITEKEQPYSTGTDARERVYFEVMPTTISDGGDEVIWAEQDTDTGKYYKDVTPAKSVEDKDSESSTYGEMIPNSALVVGTNAIGNGPQIADLEYFCMGERGDQYRNIGWPNVIKTEYMVDPSKEYDVIEIHFAFTDDGVSSYRSEKDITLVADADADPAIGLSSLADAILEAVGVSSSEDSGNEGGNG